jgi:hypothetical protein
LLAAYYKDKKKLPSRKDKWTDADGKEHNLGTMLDALRQKFKNGKINPGDEVCNALDACTPDKLALWRKGMFTRRASL